MNFEEQFKNELITLSGSYIHSLRMKVDLKELHNEQYSKLFFIENYAYERSGASKELKIPALKAVNSYFASNDKNINDYYLEFSGTARINPKRNPGFDPVFNDLSISKIIEMIDQNEIESAFTNLVRLRGIGHKIASFFIRDILILLNSDKNRSENELYLSNPIDVWVRYVYEPLIVTYSNIGLEINKKHLDDKYLRISEYMIRLVNHNPLDLYKLNIGSWYFGAKVGGVMNRVVSLVSKKSIDAIIEEIKLAKNCNGA